MAKNPPKPEKDDVERSSLSVELQPPDSMPSELSVAEQIERIRAHEIDEWREIERLTPSDQRLKRIADRFVPPTEWFDEEDLF